MHLGRHIIRAVVSSHFWVYFLLFFRCAQAVAAVAVLLDLASLPQVAGRDPEQCDNGHLLRTWLGVYAARCVALSATLWVGFRLSRVEAIDDFDGAYAHDDLTMRRIQVERTKLWLNSFGTLWAVLGAMWLFSSADCAQRAPILSVTVFLFLLLAAAGMALPLLLFSLLCCCLPFAMVGLSTFGEQLGIVPEQDEQGDDFGWIDELPAHPFSTAHPLERLRAAANPAAAATAAAATAAERTEGGASTSAAASESAASAAGRADGIVPAPADDEEVAAEEGRAGSAPAQPGAGGGWVGKLRLEEARAASRKAQFSTLLPLRWTSHMLRDASICRRGEGAR